MALRISEYDFDNGTVRHFIDSLHNQFKKLGATDFEYNKGYYYVSGFFKVNDQHFYFSISDVRLFYDNNLLIRTAKDNKDYTGGSNNYVKIKSGMYKDIARKFNLDIVTTKTIKKTPSDLALEAFTKKEFSKVLTSGKEASSIIFRLMDLFNYSAFVTENKLGRYLSSIKHESKYFYAYYSGDTKRLEITFR